MAAIGASEKVDMGADVGRYRENLGCLQQLMHNHESGDASCSVKQMDSAKDTFSLSRIRLSSVCRK